MKRMALIGGLLALTATVLMTGCPPAPSGTGGTATGPGKAGKAPKFTLAWSEYPSWSVFGVASEMEPQLINGKAGAMGILEEKWGVDIELQQLDYEPCITSFTSGKSDAVCMTNMDALNPALARKSVAIMPTSTSDGADALIVVGINDLEDLQKHKVRGLDQSVSDYAFYRLLEKNGKDPSKYTFEKLDPGEAAKQMAAKAQGIDAIMVWNPFVLQTLRDRKDSKVLFDSSKLPEEIIDMVVVGDDVLGKQGGKEFACCVAETFYEFSKQLDDKAKREKLLVDLGKKFSSLNAADMAKCCEMTKFYKTPDAGLKLFTDAQFPKTMDMIVKNYTDRKVIDKAPKLGFGAADKAGDAQLRFDPTYMKMVKDKK